MELQEEHRMLAELVAKFVDRDLMPLERAVLAREARGEKYGLSSEEERPLLEKCRELGLWALDVPEELGGANLPTAALMAINEELGRTVVPFVFPPDSPNLHMLLAVASAEQRERYLKPYASGEAISAIAISEPGAGGDPAGMTTRAVQDGNDWVINGRKIWVSRVPQSDFVIVMARTGEGKRHEGITAFIVERGTPGFIIEREISMIGGRRTYELVFEDCRVPEFAVARADRPWVCADATPADGAPAADGRLVHRHVAPGAGHAVSNMRDSASRSAPSWPTGRRFSGGWPTRRRKIHACRLMVMDAAAKQDAGKDVRTEASMVKVFATEMASEIVDHAMQTYGAMGMTKELPLQLLASQVRVMRVYEGPSEVHRMADCAPHTQCSRARRPSACTAGSSAVERAAHLVPYPRAAL